MELVFRKRTYDTDSEHDMLDLQATLDAIDIQERVKSKSELKRKAALLSDRTN